MQHTALQKPRRQIDATIRALSAAFLFFLAFGLTAATPDRALADMRGLRFYCPSGQVRAPSGYTCVSATKPNVNIVNSRANAIYVGFTEGTQWGKITWVSATGCTTVGTGLKIAPGATCAAAAVYDSSELRFCAVAAAAGTPIPNCANAQANNLTIVETTFQPASTPGCFGKGNCVWYDISLIPSTCTDALWKLNQCAGTGGASYNLPVQLTCPSQPTYTCQGPTSTLYGPENYPSNCGNPNSWQAVPPVIPQAYFFPMFYPPENAYQPNAGCLGGDILTITFLAGP